MGDYLVFILPIGFFLITLIIILTDRKDRRVSNVKRRVHDAVTEVDNKMNIFRNQLAEVEKELTGQENRAKALIQTIQSQLRETETYSDDLGRLRVAMKNYENVLDALAQLTEDADFKASQVKENAEKLVEFNSKVDELKNGFDILVNQITSSEETVLSDIKSANSQSKAEVDSILEKIQVESAQSLEDFKISAEGCINSQIEKIDYQMKKSEESSNDCIERMETRIKTLEEAARKFDESALHLLNDMGDKAYTQIQLNAELESLYAERDKLKIQLESLGQQIAERQNVNSEMEEVSRLQADRLASIKTNIRQLEAQRKQAEFEANELKEREPVEEAEPEEEIEDDIPEDYSEMQDEEEETDSQIEYTGEEEEIVFD